MATIAAAVIGIAGTAYSSYSQSQAASKAGAIASRPGRQSRVPLPGYADALNRYTARLIAANATATPPSFGDWLKSGGTATFPITNPGFTPKEAAQLHIVDPVTGKAIPFFDPTTQSNLSPEQILYLGQIRERQDEMPGKVRRLARVTGRLSDLEERLGNLQAETPITLRDQRVNARREERVTGKIERTGATKSRLEERLGLKG